MNASGLIQEKKTISNSSFFLAMKLLSGEKRRALFAVYEFCRQADDIADGEAEPAEKLARLDCLAAGIDGLFDDRRPEPRSWPELDQAIRRFVLPKDDFLAVIDGCRMDCNGLMVRPDLETLDLYCDRVAGAVGRLAVRIFGVSTDDALMLAHHQGRAMQLTNMLRDVAEDAAMGRLYVPDEFLTAKGVKGADIKALIDHPGFPAACADLAELARSHYRQADSYAALGSKKVLRCAKVMRAIYERLLGRLEIAGWGRSQSIALSKIERLWCVLRYGFW